MSNRTHAALVKQDLRIIQTARDEKSINSAARSGFFPLVKVVVPSATIQTTYAVLQNKSNGEIKVIYDPDAFGEFPEYAIAIDFTQYYPHNFPSPFAAYLLPTDIKVGERVFIEDLIEDYIRLTHRSNAFRLSGCVAIWNGNDFEVQYDPSIDQSHILG